MSTRESRRPRARFAAPAGLVVLLAGMFSAHSPGAIPDPDQVTQPLTVREPATSRGQGRDPAPVEGLDAGPMRTDAPDPGDRDGDAQTSVDEPDEPDEPEQTEEPELTATERADQRAGVLDRDVQDSASGDLYVVQGESGAPDGADHVISVSVEVERGLAVDEAAFAEFVMDTLNDPRGWGHDGSVAFSRTDGAADFRVVLASPDLTDELCAPLPTVGEYSCGREGHAVLNAVRWAQSTEAFLDKAGIETYRQYLVTHEVGHLLGHPHEDCPAPGAQAPVMQQQTITLDGCTPNGWVAP
ncbi:DUF3152 domain-containing protein [Ruania halotolerans]|uniref:DUF3152 domain-containing protein n=1 Tax=Ruania halotolerans TaxID=2897773 RepID=UPI001E2E4EB9|nr:DUF3152 domain-containing protein [Ruania halotolerans]UFU05568.1 DUF3152 domain-containing protein [Ruania halotolerans]